MKHDTNLFWQIILVLLGVLGAIRRATEWTAWPLGWSLRLSEPLFVILDMPVYHPRAFFSWWFSFNDYASDVCIRGRLTATSGGVAAIVISVARSILRVRRAQSATLCKSGPLNPLRVFSDLVQGVHAVVASRRDPQFADVLIRHIRTRGYYAC